MRFRSRAASFLRVGALLGLVGSTACASDAVPAGDASKPAVQTTPERVDIDDLACGESRSIAVSVQNLSTAPIEWTAIAEPAAALTLAFERGTIPPGDAGIVSFLASAAARPGQTIHGVIRLHLAGIEERDVDVPIALTAHGAWLESPTVIDFGVLPFDASPAHGTLTLKNIGDRPAKLSARLASTVKNGLSLAGGAALSLAPGGTADVGVSFAPQGPGGTRDSIVLDALAPLCDGPPPGIPVVASVTGGPLGLSTTTLDFGSILCGEDLGPLSVRLQNRGVAATSWTAAIDVAHSDAFELRSPASGMLDAGHDIEIVVAAKHGFRVPGRTFGDLALTTDSGTFHVALTQNRIGGAVTVLGGNAIALGRRKVGAPSQFGLSLTNAGTSPVTVQSASTGDASFANPITVPAHGSAMMVGTYTAPARLEQTSVVELVTSDLLCEPLPTVTLSAYGYARAIGAWNNICWLGDDGTGYCGNQPYARIPLGARLLTGFSTADSPCYFPDNTDIPNCWVWSARKFEARPALTGQKKSVGQYALRFDGSVVRTYDGTVLSKVSGVTDLAYTNSSEWCTIDVNGVVACWGDRDIVNGLTGTWGSVADTNPYFVPGITGARAMALSGENNPALCVAEGSGVVRCWDRFLPTTGIVAAGPTDVVKLFGGNGHMCALTAAGLLWCARGATGWEIVPLTGVIDVAVRTTRAVLSNGRMFDLDLWTSPPTVQEFE